MRRRNGQEGVAMITIMMIVVVLTLLMVATLNYAMQGEPQSRRDQDWNAALAAAQAGVDDYLYRLQQDDEYVQYSATNPPTPAQVAAARADIAGAIDKAARAVPLAQVQTLVGLAGSVTTVAAIALGLDTYDPTRIHHSVISAADVRRVSDDLLRMSHEERAALPVMHPGRVDVIGAGALILAEIVDRVGVAGVVVSEHDILDGIAWALADR